MRETLSKSSGDWRKLMPVRFKLDHSLESAVQTSGPLMDREVMLSKF